MSDTLPDYLPGRFSIAPGTAADYDALARFHYRAARPATFASIWTIRFRPARHRQSRVVAIGVLSYPVLSLDVRERALGMSDWPLAMKRLFVNRHIRSISRIIVHPQFRALGLAGMLVRQLCRVCPTRYVEALAAMGRAIRLFERAGMRRYDPAEEAKPVYYLMDRGS